MAFVPKLFLNFDRGACTVGRGMQQGIKVDIFCEIILGTAL